VVDKIYRQISRYKGKRSRRAGERFAIMEPELAAAEAVPVDVLDEDTEEQFEVVRRKQIELIAMNEEEAVEQMELLGHDFFVFYNGEKSAVNVLYRRENGGYGLLEPVIS
jgi:putative sigma-54 modulation protein